MSKQQLTMDGGIGLETFQDLEKKYPKVIEENPGAFQRLRKWVNENPDSFVDLFRYYGSKVYQEWVQTHGREPKRSERPAADLAYHEKFLRWLLSQEGIEWGKTK